MNDVPLLILMGMGVEVLLLFSMPFALSFYLFFTVGIATGIYALLKGRYFSLAFGLPCLLRDGLGRVLSAALLLLILEMLFIFGGTNEYTFLASEETIHRTALQCYGLALLSAIYSIFICRRSNASPYALKE